MNWNEIKTVLILQPENPDGDSVASALALEEILGDAGKEVIIYAYVHIPDYLKYIEGADRITNDFPRNFDMTIVVDTVTASLLDRTLKGDKLNAVVKKPVLVLDHHPVESDLPFEHAEFFTGEGEIVATGELVQQLAGKEGWAINKTAATHIIESILADTLGMNTEAVTSQTLRVVADMLDLGAQMSEIDQRRRAMMHKSPEIINYKGALLQRIEYFHEQQLAVITIPWEEIEKYSPIYNPTMLALEELRNASTVKISVGLKTYPDGKITAKIRAHVPMAGQLSAHFGGGGHDYAAGFKVMDWSYADLKKELVKKAVELLDEC